MLRGGKGVDILSDVTNGEDGLKDIFFLEKDMGFDVVVGFDQGTDVFWLSKSQFGDLDFNQNGVLANGQVHNSTVPTATIGGAQLIYETDAKILWYDQDGTGGKAAVSIASLSGFSGSLVKSDFLVVPDI